MKFHPPLLLTLLFCLLGIVEAPRLFAEGERVEFELSPGPYYPGDVLEARFTLVCSEFRRWDLQAPQHERLRLVSEQEFPTQATGESEYKTTWVVLYQCIANGEGAFTGGFFERTLGYDTFNIAIEEKSVAVSKLEEFDEDETLEPLPPLEHTGAASFDWLWWIAAIAAACVAALLFVRHFTATRVVELEKVESSLDRLTRDVGPILASASITREQALYLINAYKAELSAECLDALKQAAYARASKVQDVLAALRKEVAS